MEGSAAKMSAFLGRRVLCCSEFMGGNCSSAWWASPFLPLAVSPLGGTRGRPPLGWLMPTRWTNECQSSQIVQRARAELCTCFRHHDCGSEPAPVRGRVVTPSGGRSSKMADFQQDAPWDLLLPSGSKRAAQGRCTPGRGFTSYFSFHTWSQRPSVLHLYLVSSMLPCVSF